MLKRLSTYLSIVQNLVEQYNGNLPLAAFLKNYFSQNKKHGSTDRKYITHLCYCYYRLGKSLPSKCFDERVLVAIFLCHSQSNEYSILFKEIWLHNWTEKLADRINFIKQLYNDFDVADVFKTQQTIGVADKTPFALSHLIQPNLFVRIRPQYELVVKDKLQKNNVVFEQINDTCLALNNRTKIGDILKVNKEVVVQDYSSQQVESLMQLVKENSSKPIVVWDCCAASGGKSILAKDVFNEMQLTVSDIRTSIIANLKKRFEEAGIKKYTSYVADISQKNSGAKNYNFIICDVPCSGSGTWSRTPENLVFFEADKVNAFADLQKKIATNAMQCLQKGGYFLYITCSVFSKENTEVVEYLLLQKNIELVEQKYFEGFEMQADTMFAALLKKVG